VRHQPPTSRPTSYPTLLDCTSTRATKVHCTPPGVPGDVFPFSLQDLGDHILDQQLCSPGYEEPLEDKLPHFCVATAPLTDRVALLAPQKFHTALGPQGTYSVIWDSGASCCISPSLTDFISPITPVDKGAKNQSRHHQWLECACQRHSCMDFLGLLRNVLHSQVALFTCSQDPCPSAVHSVPTPIVSRRNVAPNPQHLNTVRCQNLSPTPPPHSSVH
jgi:hypothetical protein